LRKFKLIFLREILAAIPNIALPPVANKSFFPPFYRDCTSFGNIINGIWKKNRESNYHPFTCLNIMRASGCNTNACASIGILSEN
jgi:hypothetical protein